MLLVLCLLPCLSQFSHCLQGMTNFLLCFFGERYHEDILMFSSVSMFHRVWLFLNSLGVPVESTFNKVYSPSPLGSDTCNDDGSYQDGSPKKRPSLGLHDIFPFRLCESVPEFPSGSFHRASAVCGALIYSGGEHQYCL